MNKVKCRDCVVLRLAEIAADEKRFVFPMAIILPFDKKLACHGRDKQLDSAVENLNEEIA